MQEEVICNVLTAGYDCILHRFHVWWQLLTHIIAAQQIGFILHQLIATANCS